MCQDLKKKTTLTSSKKTWLFNYFLHLGNSNFPELKKNFLCKKPFLIVSFYLFILFIYLFIYFFCQLRIFDTFALENFFKYPNKLLSESTSSCLNNDSVKISPSSSRKFCSVTKET